MSTSLNGNDKNIIVVAIAKIKFTTKQKQITWLVLYICNKIQ